jgi:uncharacterized coiled-coil protein SlyX
MCQFTCIEWALCGHKQLSTTPAHTRLCNLAIHFLDQGIHCALAECYQVPEDLSSLEGESVDPKIAQTIYYFEYCKDCKADPDVAPGERKFGSPDIVTVEVGFYSESDKAELVHLRDLLISCIDQCKVTIQNFEEELSKHPEAVQTEITVTLDNIIGTQLPAPDTKICHYVLDKSIEDARILLETLNYFMTTHVPQRIFLDLLALVQKKIFQADKRRENFYELLKPIRLYDADYKLVLEHFAKEIALGLGRVYEPTPRENAHLKTRDWVDERTPPLAGSRYTPSSSFTAGKKRKALHDAPKRAENSNWPLRIDTDVARNPPAGTEDKLEMHWEERVEIVYIEGLATRTTLRPLDIGRGPWGTRDVLDDERSATLLARLERENQQLQPSSEVGRTVPEDATFMGERLVDLDDDDDEVKGKKSDAVDNPGEKVNETEEQVDKTEEQVAKTGKEVNRTVAEVNTAVAEVNTTVAKVNKTVAEFNKTVAEFNKTVAEVNKTVAEADKTVEEVEEITPPSRKGSWEDGPRKRRRTA